ncbi:hypothetical protein LF887_16315 [Chryseobacterium sp. MEBOG06]|uniref:hypothetical protein n=1 Tax=Chryseobacterium sp. MEBOG06 TaxID=2879938 RepID=UPI001F47EDCB|nr:hypothetical protein [Chryseobacterium sp. MEBOG06]UKB82569.1 hypothetical protein LF887_16315 [Chryseobacterium sp. MEBOG06]
MNSKEFKEIFGEIAKNNAFESAFGGWFNDGVDSIVVLDLQKSNYGEYFELNIKIYVQGMFGNNYFRNKDLVKKEIGNVSRRQPSEYRSLFNFDEPMNDQVRKNRLEQFFTEFITPFTERALSISGLLELEKRKEIHITPAVNEELNRLLK